MFELRSLTNFHYIEVIENMEEKTFDIVICGAGPAGTTCALALAGKGLKVALLEKYEFPRDKVCGDAIAAYVPAVLGTIDPDHKRAVENFMDRQPVDTCRIFGPNQKFSDISYSKEGFIAKRIHWDNFLFNLVTRQKDISIFTDYRVTDVHIDTDMRHVRVFTPKATFNCRLVIGCDGAHSVVRKKFAKERMNHHHHAGAVRAYFKNVTDIPEKTFELHFLKGILPGYLWIFPLKDGVANVGLGLLSSKISEQKISIRGLLEKTIRESYLSGRFAHAEIEGEIEGFGLPLGSRKIPLSGDHFMLCGDAASLIDPLSGEGIGQAMVSGRYAGWHAAKCFEKNNFSQKFLSTYDAQVYQKFWRKHHLDHLVQRMISDRDWLFNGILNLGIKSKWVKKMVVKALM